MSLIKFSGMLSLLSELLPLVGFEPDFGIRSRFWDFSLMLGFSGIGPHFGLSSSVELMLLLS